MARDDRNVLLLKHRRRRKPPTLQQLMARQRRKTQKLVATGFVAFVLTVSLGLAWPKLQAQFGQGSWPTTPGGMARNTARSGGLRPDAVRIARVIDGDTVDLAGGERVRILNIDTAEMPPRSRCDREADLAIRAKARLGELVRDGREVTLAAGGRDRDGYGRLLRWVRIDGEDVGDRLIREGLAQPWAGHKAHWC